MREDYEDRRRRQVRMPMLILGSVMIVIYFCLGAAILMFPKFFNNPSLNPEYVRLLAIALLIYSGYRAWRLYTDYF